MERNIRRFLKTPPQPHGKNPQTPHHPRPRRVRPRKAGFIRLSLGPDPRQQRGELGLRYDRPARAPDRVVPRLRAAGSNRPRRNGRATDGREPTVPRCLRLS